MTAWTLAFAQVLPAIALGLLATAFVSAIALARVPMTLALVPGVSLPIALKLYPAL